MANPFTGIITSEFKQLFVNAISSLLADDALTVPCRIIFGTTKNTQCPNCVLDTITKASSNKYNGIGPNSFPTGSICPVCGSLGYIASDTSETLYLSVLWQWQRAKFIDIGIKLNVGESYAQTISLLGTLHTLRRAKEAVLDTSAEGHGKRTYEREGEPTPLGLGDTKFVITLWKRKI
jgi:hypothetical protein